MKITPQIIQEERGLDRWGQGVPHHRESLALMAFIRELDREVYDGHFDWRTGGDGDNGETLMYQMDAYFERVTKERG